MNTNHDIDDLQVILSEPIRGGRFRTGYAVRPATDNEAICLTTRNADGDVVQLWLDDTQANELANRILQAVDVVRSSKEHLGELAWEVPCRFCGTRKVVLKRSCCIYVSAHCFKCAHSVTGTHVTAIDALCAWTKENKPA